MSSQLTDDQNILFKEIAEQEGISDYEVEVNSASEKGDGYLGVISTVNLIKEHKRLNLILKTAETNEELRKKIVVRKAYLREIYIYNRVFPVFKNFQREHGLRTGFNAFAKMYGSCEEDCKECLILENLKEIGYTLWNRKVPMNSEHVELVFTEYGKFHALSLAMRDREPETFTEVTKDLRHVFENAYSPEEFEHAIKMSLEKGFKAVKGDDRATEGFRKFSSTLKTFLIEELTLPEYQIVITHGDCWCNNMMFKYEVSLNLTKI